MSYSITFAGSGSAFTMKNFQSNIVVQHNGYPKDTMLIDCGSDIRWSLSELGLSYRDVPSVYVSHLHADHIGGLEWLAFCSYFDSSCEKPQLFISKKLVGELWNHCLVGGLGSLQCSVAELSTYFDIYRLSDNKNFECGGVVYQPVQTIHVYDGLSIRYSFGLLFNIGEKRIFITTDSQFCPEQIMDFYKMSDIIFHDCETSPFESHVHAHYNKMRTLPDEVKSKMWLYHYQDGELPDAGRDGFLGFVKKGQKFEFEE